MLKERRSALAPCLNISGCYRCHKFYKCNYQQLPLGLGALLYSQQACPNKMQSSLGALHQQHVGAGPGFGVVSMGTIRRCAALWKQHFIKILGHSRLAHKLSAEAQLAALHQSALQARASLMQRAGPCSPLLSSPQRGAHPYEGFNALPAVVLQGLRHT